MDSEAILGSGLEGTQTELLMLKAASTSILRKLVSGLRSKVIGDQLILLMVRHIYTRVLSEATCICFGGKSRAFFRGWSGAWAGRPIIIPVNEFAGKLLNPKATRE